MANTRYGEDIAVLKQEMKDVKTVLTRIEIKIDNLPETYITRKEVTIIKAILGLLVAAITCIATVMLARH